MKKLVFPFLVASLLLAGAGSALMSCKNSTTAFTEQALERQNKVRAIDDSLIRAYLGRHNYGPGTYTRTDAGLYLVPLVKNPEGLVAATGKQVAIKYIGKFVQLAREDIIFDSSINGKTICNCIPVLVGDTNPITATITGWNQALPLMRNGERTLLFVPSYLAYGIPGRQGSSIGPDTPLLFDMEIVAVSQ